MNKKLLIALAAAALFVGSNCAENEEATVETEVIETETTVETVEETVEETTTSSGNENIIVTENAEIDLGALEEGVAEEGTGEETEEIPSEGGSGSGTIDGSGSGSGTVEIDTEALSGQVLVTSGAALVALAALLA